MCVNVVGRGWVWVWVWVWVLYMLTELYSTLLVIK